MNRIKELLDDGSGGEGSPTFGDFYVVRAQFGCFHVTREAALHVERCLDRRWVPRWITFADVVGSRIRLRSATVHGVYECTAAQRAAERKLDRERRLEEKSDRQPWEDYD
jgi:hypothetical protein